jgi:hypothetical protein
MDLEKVASSWIPVTFVWADFFVCNSFLVGLTDIRYEACCHLKAFS